jgi:CRP-like cAMP-binding protein
MELFRKRASDAGAEPPRAAAPNEFERLLADLTPDGRDGLLSLAETRHFSPGELVVREGGAADALYLITQGHVALEVHVPGRGAVLMERLGPGDLPGLSWLFPGPLLLVYE